MTTESNHKENQDLIGPESPHFSTEEDTEECDAWTEVEEGRYMPRRVRGSCKGRALG